MDSRFNASFSDAIMHYTVKAKKKIATKSKNVVLGLGGHRPVYE